MYSADHVDRAELSDSSRSSSPRRSRYSSTSSSSGSEIFVTSSKASVLPRQIQRPSNPTRSPPPRGRTRSNRPETRTGQRLSTGDDEKPDDEEPARAQSMMRSQSASANHRRGNKNHAVEKLDAKRELKKHRKPKPVHSAPPRCYRNVTGLNHPKLTRGQRSYLWDIAYVYDVTPMKRKLKSQYEGHIMHKHDLGTMEDFDIEHLIDRVHQPRKLVFMSPEEFEEKKRDWNRKHKATEKRDRPSTAPLHRVRPASAYYSQPARPKTAAPSRPKTAHHQRSRTMNNNSSHSNDPKNYNESTLVSQLNGIDLSSDSDYDA